jgi:hypothetical protein
MLARDSHAAPIPGEADDPPPHHAPKAKRVIQIFLQGGLSQVDSFDYKPGLAKLHGKPVPGDEKPTAFMGKVGLLHRHHFEFKQRGKSGLWISDLFPHIAELADELTVINSMWSGTGNHTPATYEANSGFRTLGFPAAGTWASYGLGCEVDNLPTFVVLPDSRSLPTGGSNNWSSGFLPARHQGVVLNTKGPAVRDLRPASKLDGGVQADRFAALAELNRRHLAERGGDDALESRIRSYELAARMQLAIPEAVDLARESAETHELYGVDRKECSDFARGCLMARRLVERGVRFVQLWSGAAFGSEVHWDAHGSVPDNHRRESAKIDPSPRCCGTCAAAACSTIRSWCSTPSSAAPPTPKAPETKPARAAITTPTPSASGWRVRGSSTAWPTAPRTRSAGRRRPIRSTYTTSTPPSCTCWASTTPGSPSTTTASTAG